MARVDLPPLLTQLLESTEFRGPVEQSLTECSQFFGDPTRNLPFFPEYTEHGVKHVQRVLDSTCQLVAEVDLWESAGVAHRPSARIGLISVM